MDGTWTGTRHPGAAWVISPHAKRGDLEPTVYEHASTLKFIQTVFGVPTLASANHAFDTETPGGPDNEAAGGASAGPPAPPHDGVAWIGNLTERFVR
jgi:phospholipase C